MSFNPQDSDIFFGSVSRLGWT